MVHNHEQHGEQVCIEQTRAEVCAVCSCWDWDVVAFVVHQADLGNAAAFVVYQIDEPVGSDNAAAAGNNTDCIAAAVEPVAAVAAQNPLAMASNQVAAIADIGVAVDCVMAAPAALVDQEIQTIALQYPMLNRFTILIAQAELLALSVNSIYKMCRLIDKVVAQQTQLQRIDWLAR